jgi:NAD(P)-dependent dehydrogenase (short-subunit alcohol dehydrogenase family)
MQSAQKPLRSGFDRRSTTEEVLGDADLSGTFAIVTGGYAGIGKETVRALHKAGASVLVPARNIDKAKAALAGFERVRVASLDLADGASITRFAAEVTETGRPLDLLIANAGIMATPLMRDARGYELQLSTNHLGHFQLAAQLWPSLRRSGRARVVCLSSGAHRFSGVDFDDPNFERRPYDRWKAYGQSKTANALFALGLDIRGEAHGVRAFSVHPGVIETELVRHLTQDDLRAMGFVDEHGNLAPAMAERRKTVEQGAATTVWCAVSRQLDSAGGVYCEDCDVSRALTAEDTSLEGVLPWATDRVAAERLWEMSERLTDVKFAL